MRGDFSGFTRNVCKTGFNKKGKIQSAPWIRLTKTSVSKPTYGFLSSAGWKPLT